MKLHLGCGKIYIPGFVHIDIVDRPHIDHIASIDRLTFIGDNSVDLIYNCCVLEHFKRASTTDVLKEWFRVLKPGGILRTSVPDFEALCKIYLTNGKLGDVIGPLLGRQNYLYNIHYNLFDFTTLSDCLGSVGFINTKKYDWRKTEHADIDDYSQAYLPHMDKISGVLTSLNIESEKP